MSNFSCSWMVFGPNLWPSSVKKTNEGFVKSIRDLAYVMDKMANVENIPGIQNAKSRENLAYSARALFATASASDSFIKAMNSFDCNTETPLKDWTKLAALATEELSNVMGTLGYFRNAKEIRTKATFVNSLAETLENWPSQPQQGEACKAGNLERAAAYSRDIANTLKTTGLEELANKYGIVF